MQQDTYKNQTAIITGASRGIGLASAKALAKKGFDIAICARGLEELKKAEDEITALGVKCFSRTVDVSKEDEVVVFVNDVYETFGSIDVLVNNAGRQLNKPFVDLSADEWHDVLGVNLDSYFYFCKYAGKYMIEQKKGKIINISSVLSKFALPCRAPYSVSKAGIESLTRVLAAEWAGYNILVNAISPGHIDTELIRRDIKKGLLDEESMKSRSCLLRIGDAQEIGSIVSFLASDESSYITGQTLVADGGFSIKK
ncbi:MAG: SDR family oxidoreductase [Candidatus Omnitrophota bacterium]